MTEIDWQAGTDPRRLIAHLRDRGGVTARRWRLFVAAFWRWQAARMDASGDLLARVNAMEAWADTGRLPPGRRASRSRSVIFFAADAAQAAANTAAAPPGWLAVSGGPAAVATQVALIRDVFGNPFRPVAFDPRWRTADVSALARAIYDDRAFDRLPILADALMDAGCDDEPLIAHCRGPGPHVRGCWVIDLVLGKS